MFKHERLKSDLNLSLIILHVSKMRAPRETEKTETEKQRRMSVGGIVLGFKLSEKNNK
jgi:hypothetical protein